MIFFKRLLTLFIFLPVFFARGAGFSPILNTSVGMFNLNLTENTSTLSSTDSTIEEEGTTAAEAISSSVTAFEVNYEFLIYPKKSFFVTAIVPLVSQDGSGIFMGNVGVNFYLNTMSTVFSFNDKGTSIAITPKFRYYWGGSTGIGYVVYNTISAKKSDVFFNLGLHGGGVYNFKKSWGIRGEVGLGRGTGVATSSISLKFLVGATYYLGL